jgi:hypothetical protein
MTEHKIEIRTQIGIDANGAANGAFRYRWSCSCGAGGKRWQHGTAGAQRSRTAGDRHVAEESTR